MQEMSDVDYVVRKLHAVKVYQSHYAGARPTPERIKELCDILVAEDSKHGKYGGLCRNVADAICKAYLQQPYDEVLLP
jgi:hypothetical protein